VRPSASFAGVGNPQISAGMGFSAHACFAAGTGRDACWRAGEFGSGHRYAGWEDRWPGPGFAAGMGGAAGASRYYPARSPLPSAGQPPATLPQRQAAAYCSLHPGEGLSKGKVCGHLPFSLPRATPTFTPRVINHRPAVENVFTRACGPNYTLSSRALLFSSEKFTPGREAPGACGHDGSDNLDTPRL